jgi:uncharacterized protein (DUF58 family)
MPVPTNKLVCWTLLAGIPAALLAAAGPAGVAAAACITTVYIIVVLVDGFFGRALLENVEARCVETVRFQRGVRGEIELEFLNPTQRTLHARLSPVLPATFASDLEYVSFSSAPETVALMKWACTPFRRGKFILEHCNVETITRMGLWAVRRTLAVRGELRVYPDILSERRNVAALFLNRGREGMHVQRFSGKGREFEKLREYVPGDSREDIHWRATAKRGHPVTKVYQLERTQEVYVVIDSSRLSARAPGEAGGTGANVLERFLAAAMILGIAAERQGDLFGLMTFSDKVDLFVRARNGQNHFNACRDSLFAVQPKIVTPSYEAMASFIRTRLRKRALLVILTAFDDPALSEAFVHASELLCRQHLMLVNMVRPADIGPLFEGSVDSPEEIYRRLAGHLQWRQLAELRKVLGRRGIDFNLLADEKLAAELVSQYLRVKNRQIL